MPGMHGHYTAVTAMQRSDLLINLGARFDDRVTGKISTFAPEAKVIHVDIDPAELGKVRDARRGHRGGLPPGDRASCCWPWTPGGDRARRAGPRAVVAPDPRVAGALPALLRRGRRRGDQAAERRRAAARRGAEDTIVVAGVGQHQMWASQYWNFEHPYTWVNSGGAGTMGFAVPACHRGQGRPARAHRVGHRRRRLLPDDGAGAGDGELRADPGEDRDLEQRVSRHGAPVAGDVLRGALLGGLPLARPARLREVGRGHGLRRHPGRDARGRRARPSRRRTRSTTGRSWSTSAPTPSRRCSRWCRPVRRTTTSWCTPTRRPHR